ncbi:hypothetical protein L571_2379, partial [Bordetella pertussis 2371640]
MVSCITLSDRTRHGAPRRLEAGPARASARDARERAGPPRGAMRRRKGCRAGPGQACSTAPTIGPGRRRSASRSLPCPRPLPASPAARPRASFGWAGPTIGAGRPGPRQWPRRAPRISRPNPPARRAANASNGAHKP